MKMEKKLSTDDGKEGASEIRESSEKDDIGVVPERFEIKKDAKDMVKGNTKR